MRSLADAARCAAGADRVMPAIASKLPDVGTTIFTVMSRKAEQHGAINLSQGFPDFPLPPALGDALARHVAAGHNQYAPMAGVLRLREQIALQRSIRKH